MCFERFPKLEKQFLKEEGYDAFTVDVDGKQIGYHENFLEWKEEIDTQIKLDAIAVRLGWRDWDHLKFNEEHIEQPLKIAIDMILEEKGLQDFKF